MSENRAGKGCWTCRARRKRCDGLMPECDTCTRLGIACAGFRVDRPEWMDGEDKQQDYCRRLKACIKQHRRREPTSTKQHVSSLNSRTAISDFSARQGTTVESFESQDSFSFSESALEISLVSNALTSVDPSFDGFDLPIDLQLMDSITESNEDFDSALLAQLSNRCYDSTWETCPGLDIEQVDSQFSKHSSDVTDWSLIMRYFDCCFSKLLVVYCSLLAQEGRAWLLSMINRSYAVRLAVMSVASRHCFAENSATGDAVSNKSRHYQELAKQELAKLDQSWISGGLIGEQKNGAMVEVLGCIVHFIILERLYNPLGTPSDLLGNAVNLLRVTNQGRTSSLCGQRDVVYDIEERGVLMCKTILLHYVVFSRAAAPSTSCNILQMEIDDLFDTGSWQDIVGGCPRSVLHAIIEITELVTWKRDAKNAGTLSMMELVDRARRIQTKIDAEERIRNDIIHLPNEEIASQKDCSVTDGDTGCHSQARFRCHSHQCIAETSAVLYTRAAQVYLHMVVSGPNAKLPEISVNVTRGLNLLRTSARCIENAFLAWPICILACMIDSEGEDGTDCRRWFEENCFDGNGHHTTHLQQILEVVTTCWSCLDEEEVEGCEWISSLLNMDSQLPYYG